MTEKRTPPWVIEGNLPTPEEWVDWFLTVPAEDKLDLARLAISFSNDSVQCFAEDHVGRIADMTQTIQAQRECIEEFNTFIAGVSERVGGMQVGIHDALAKGIRRHG